MNNFLVTFNNTYVNTNFEILKFERKKRNYVRITGKLLKFQTKLFYSYDFFVSIIAQKNMSPF